MPISNQANADTIRADGHQIPCFASFYAPDPVAIAEIAALVNDPFDVSVASLLVTYDSGAYTDVAKGAELTFHDPVTGAFKGRSHVRYDSSGATIGGVIPIRETSNAALTIAVGDKVRVYREHRLHDKLVAATTTFGGFPPDILVYTDQGSNPPPVATSGGHWAGDISQLPFQDTGANAYNADPDSVSTPTHARTLPTGLSFASGNGTSQNPTITGDPGMYLYDHTVTDPDNGKTTTQHIVVMIHDADNPPHDVLITNYIGSPESGWGWEIEVTSGATDLDTIPDGCLCILWSRERYNGSQQSFRNISSGRSHILGVGYVRRDRASGDSSGSVQVSFEVVSPLQRMREITSYSKVMEANATPDAWSEIKTLSVKRAIIQLLQFYTTLVESGFDLIFDSAFVNPTYPTFYLQRSNFYDQTKELTWGVDGRMCCDRTARFDLHTDLPFIPRADRAAITKPFRFKPEDVLEYDLPREHFDTVEQYKVSGVSAGSSNNQPFFSLYPGAAPGEAVNTPTRDRLIVDETTPQDDLNERAGRYGALEDRVYVDADGNRLRTFDLRMRMRGAYDFVDFDKAFYDFETTLPDLPRDIDLTDYLFYPISSHSIFEGGTSEVEIVFRAATHAEAGESYFPPTETLLPPGDTPPNAPITTPVSRIPLWTNQLPIKAAAIRSDGAAVARATSFTPGVEFDWEIISTGLTGNGIWITADPYNYSRYYALTDTGLFVCDNLWTASPSFSLVANNLTLFGNASRVGHKIVMSHNKKGWLLIPCGKTGIAVSFTHGASWTQTAIDGGSPVWSTSLSITDMSEAVIFGYNTASFGGLLGWCVESTTLKHVKSEDWGLTWSVIGTAATGSSTKNSFACPYKLAGGVANDDWDNVVYYFVAAPDYLVRVDGQVFPSGQTLVWTGSTSNSTGSALTQFTHDGVTYQYWVEFSGASVARLLHTDDALSTAASNYVTGSNNTSFLTNLEGWSMNPDAAIASCRANPGFILATLDGGQTDWWGNLPTGWGGCGRALFDLSDYIPGQA